MSTVPADPIWSIIQRYLESEMRRVREEISNYPSPIPACDAQFNFLLQEREALTTEITRVRDIRSGCTSSEDMPVTADAYLEASPHLDASAKQAIRASARKEKR